ncbi:MAG: tyrosine-type recombinase/integrase [Bacteroidetes bacterium]|nr:tyrosine-type recombinase/integrase [Bacteroidota bacterium]
MKKINELITEYLDHLRSLRYSGETLRNIQGYLLHFNCWLLERCRIEEVTSINKSYLQRWCGYLSTLRTKKGYPLKATTLNRHIIAIRGFLNHLTKEGFIHANILDALPYLKEPKRLPGTTLDHAQVKKLLARVSTNSTEGYRNRAMLELLYSSGIRIRELLGLNVDDVELTHHVALIHGKGDKERMVPIGKTALRFLESYIAGVRPYLAISKMEKALFLGKDGSRLSYSSFRRMLAKVEAECGMDCHITAHTFRRSCTTELIRSGANMYHVKELLGHESLDTLKHYAKLTITDLKKTHEKCHPRERDK